MWTWAIFPRQHPCIKKVSFLHQAFYSYTNPLGWKGPHELLFLPNSVLIIPVSRRPRLHLQSCFKRHFKFVPKLNRKHRALPVLFLDLHLPSYQHPPTGPCATISIYHPGSILNARVPVCCASGGWWQRCVTDTCHGNARVLPPAPRSSKLSLFLPLWNCIWAVYW